MNDHQNSAKPKHSGSSNRRNILLIISLILVAGAFYYLLPVVIVVFIVQPVKVEGSAMSPTLNNGDRIFVNKRVANISRGDIIVFYYPHDHTKSFIKRVIGLPGERIDVDADGNVTINGRRIEDYVSQSRNQSALARWRQVRDEWKTIGSDSYFVMGDNRDASNDSRSWGPVSKDLIYGKYWMRYWASGD